MGDKKKLINNITSLGIIQFVNYIFPLITVPYIARIIGPDGYGIINYATAFIGYFTLIISYGFDLTATRKISHHISDMKLINNVISEVLTSRIILFIISFLLFMISISVFSPIQKDITVAIILFVGCIGTVISPQYIYQGFQELSIIAKLNFVKGLINTALVFVLIKKASDYYWIPVLATIFLLSINIFLLFYAKYKFDLRYKLCAIGKALKIIKDERMIFFSTVVINLYTTTNTVVLGFFANTKDVGYFTTSQSFLGIVTSILTIPISTALYPFIGNAFSVSKENGLNMIKKIFPIIFYITFITCLGVLTLAPILIKIIYGNSFDHSIPILRIISFLPFIIGISNIFGIQLMLNMGLDNLFFKTTLIASIIGVILNLFMSKFFGYFGTAWNIVIIETLVTTLMYFSLKKQDINVIELKYFHPKLILSLLKKESK